MTRQANDVLRQALELSTLDRAALASSLIDSLDPEVDQDAEEAWKREVERRIKESDSGKSRTVSWEDLHRRLAARLHNAK